MVFDTGSGHLFLPSAGCQDEPCTKHRRYKESESASAEPINDDGSRATNPNERDSVSIAYGTGEILGDFVREVVCVGQPAPGTALRSGSSAELPQHCTEARVILAKQMTSEPFRDFEFDGVLGLGLDSLALNSEFHMFGQLSRGQGKLKPVFGVFLSRDDSTQSEVAFGGHDESRTGTVPLRWVPVASPQLGYWRLALKSVKVGNRPLALCESGEQCYAVLDTGTSLLGVPRQGLSSLLAATARRVAAETEVEDCRQVPGPSIVFELGDFSLQLDAEDYSRPAPSVVTGTNTAGGAGALICRASMLPVEMPALGTKVFLFGEPVLRKYYTAYDAGLRRVGFAEAVHSKVSNSSTMVV